MYVKTVCIDENPYTYMIDTIKVTLSIKQLGKQDVCETTCPWQGQGHKRSMMMPFESA